MEIGDGDWRWRLEMVTGLDMSWVKRPTSRLLNINKFMHATYAEMVIFGQNYHFWPKLRENDPSG